MRTFIFCGKGGVGKTTSAVSLGLFLAKEGEKTLIVDYDGGHSVQSTLCTVRSDSSVCINNIHLVQENLCLAVIESTDYLGIMDVKKRGDSVQIYLAQFPNESGIVPLADMVNSFFGVPTDTVLLQKFTTLVRILKQAEEDGFENIIIDVEPTAGLERFLSNAEGMMRSLRNLQKQGIINLALLRAKWPDIAEYLSSGYIRNADQHCKDIRQAVEIIKEAFYFLVCTPESGPVKQVFEVWKIVSKFSGNVHGFVVNNMRGENHEEQNIEILLGRQLPVVRIRHRGELHVAGADRASILLETGRVIAKQALKY